MDSRRAGQLRQIASEDVDVLVVKDAQYGESWKKRGGVGAFMMAARKWDRLENGVQHHGYDIFELVLQDEREEGALDDIADLRRYLLLIEGEIRAQLVERRVQDLKDQTQTLVSEAQSFLDTGGPRPEGPQDHPAVIMR